jgi:hypothetical protein
MTALGDYAGDGFLVDPGHQLALAARDGSTRTLM